MIRDRTRAVLEILLIEVIFFAVWYYMYGSFLVGHAFLFGDVGISYLNGRPIDQLLSFNPNYLNVLEILIFHVNYKVFPIFFDSYLFFIPFIVPLGFYYLVWSLGFKGSVRMLSTLFYSLNPLMLMFSLGGLEYTGLFLFFPLILAFQIRYFKSSKLTDIVISFILIFLLFNFLGFSNLKFIVFIFVAMSIIDIFLAGRNQVLGNLKNYLLATCLLAVISIPILLFFFSELGIYSASAAANTSTINGLVGITKFEFANSNILTSLYALPYVSNQLTAIHYESSWDGLWYLFLVIFGLVSVLKYDGEYRYVYYALFSVICFLILFQYGVYNGTLIHLYYQYPFLDVFNYPLFLNISQILIYALFIAVGLEIVMNYLKRIDSKTKRKRSGKPLVYLVSIAVALIIVTSSVPVMIYEHGTNPTTLASNEVPSYVFNMVSELKPYSNTRVLILPDNGTTLAYAYTGVSYYDVYGLPYGYQNFVSLFPNYTRYSDLGNAFQDNNVTTVSDLLRVESINAIVVLNTLSNQPISVQGTSINGGGRAFDEIINETNLYQNVFFSNNYSIYKYNPNASLGLGIPNSSVYYDHLSYEKSATNITTSTLSYISYPIYISPAKSKSSGYYDYEISISKENFSGIDNNFSNILFAYQNGTIIPAWISSIYSGTASIYLNITGEINRTIEFRIYPKTVNEMKEGYLGEAPQLSGQGSNVLPLYILYSSAVIGVYGYGYDGNTFTYNFTFDPSDFSTVLNDNLSNLAFFTYNGSVLPSHLDSYSTTSATVTISFPDGVNYFKMYPTNSGPYNVFYMGFAAGSDYLNALNSSIVFNASSTSTALLIDYIPYPVKDFGVYNEYDNGKAVFPYFNSFIGGLAQGNPWSFEIPVSGYGFFAVSGYEPDAYHLYNLYNISGGQEAVTYSYMFVGLFGDKGISAPLYISNATGSALMGNIPLTDVTGGGVNQTILQHSLDIGMGGNSTRVSLFTDSNISGTYTETTSNSTSVTGFNNYTIYDSSGLYFRVNGENLGYADYSGSLAHLSLSNVYEGSMISLYCLVSNSVTFSYAIGTPTVYQAYLEGSAVQNPAYSNSTVTFTFFSPNQQNNSVQWNISGISFTSSSVSYNFQKPGNYVVSVTAANKSYGFTESILALPETGSQNITFSSTGAHTISTMSSGDIYEWYVNGIPINANGTTLSFDFKYYGTYAVRVFTLGASGNFSDSYIVSISYKSSTNSVDYLYLLYTGLLPAVLIAFIVSKKFRNLFSK